MDVTVIALQYFVVLADELHFGRAAGRLGIASPSLSQQIRRLEGQLRQELFERRPDGVRLTHAGQALLPLAQETLDAHHRIVEWASAQKQQRLSPPLRLGMTGVGLGHVSAIIAESRKAQPELRFEIVRIHLFDIADALKAGQVDAALTFGPVEPIPGQAAQVLGTEDRVLVVPAQHRFAGRSSVRISETNDETLLAPAGASDLGRRWWVVDPRPDGSSPRVIAATDDVEGVVALCAAGEGITIAAGSAAMPWALGV